MNSISKKVLTAASALAIAASSLATPALAWHNWYEGNPYGGGYYGNPYGGGWGGGWGGGYGGYPYGGGYYGYNRGHRVLKTTLIGAGIGAAVGLGYGLLSGPRWHHHRHYGYWE